MKVTYKILAGGPGVARGKKIEFSAQSVQPVVTYIQTSCFIIDSDYIIGYKLRKIKTAR